MANWVEFSTEFRDRLKEEAPEHIFDLWFERDEDSLIWNKYKLTEWQIKSFNDLQRDIFLKDIPLITFANEIKSRLKIKDQRVANNIALDIAIHTFSKAKDYFKGTDNLIKSLGGEEEYWKKYSPNYWNEIEISEPLISTDDMKNAYNIAKNDILKAENTLKELEKSNLKDVIPKTYNQISSNLEEVKTKLDSENYDLILKSEGLAKRVIKDANNAKNKALNIQKNIPRKIEIEKEVQRRKASCIKKRNQAKTYIIAHFLGIICFVLAIFNFSGFFYLIFAIITGNTQQFVGTNKENDDSFTQIFASFVVGFVLAPTYLFPFLDDLKYLISIKNRNGFQMKDLTEELAKMEHE